MVVVQQTVRVVDGQIIVLGQAVNPSEVTFDRADVSVALYDASGHLLNKAAKDEISQTAGADIAPGNVFPYRWSQAEPATYARAVVTITGVDAADAQAVPSVRMTVLRRRDDGSGSTTVVAGTIESGCRQTIAITAEVAAYDSSGNLIALGSAMFGDDPMIVLDPDAGSWQFSVRLDAFVEDIAAIRVFPAGSVS